MYLFSTFELAGSKDVDVGSSCSSLKQSGHFISGYYNIKQEEVRKVVFCDMGSGSYGEVPQADELDLSTRGAWCGYQDDWSTANAVITYDTLLLNDTTITGTPLDISTGKYHISINYHTQHNI